MKKIMFNDLFGLTQAVLDGLKPMTRRILKVPIEEKDVERIEWRIDDNGKAFMAIFEDDALVGCVYPMYQPGEVVAVAQSYKSIHKEMMNGDYGDSRYDAFRSAMVSGTKGWNNKMFVKSAYMPQHIRITKIKVEKLQDISDEDCLKEGIIGMKGGFGIARGKDYIVFGNTPRDAFAALIDKVSGKGTWEHNPFVVVYEFQLVRS